jgi:hypothetical protein
MWAFQETTMSNSEIKKLTIKELKAFEGLENLTNEQAKEAIDTIVTFSVIMFHIHNDQKLKQDGASSAI